MSLSKLNESSSVFLDVHSSDSALYFFLSTFLQPFFLSLSLSLVFFLSLFLLLQRIERAQDKLPKRPFSSMNGWI